MSYQQEHFTAIADKIRERTNTTALIVPKEFASKIDDVYWAGHADGNNAGYSMGWEDGEEYGMKREYDRFWDAYQDYGKRRDYNYSFAGNMWDDETYNPKYEIIIDNNLGTNLFRGNRQFTDTKVPIRVLAKGTSYVFNNCENLKRIPLLEVVEDLAYTGWFSRCSALVEITIMGTIGNDISFADCSLLTHDSLMSIINALKDYSGTTTTHKLTLHADSKALLTENEIAAASQKGWTIT